MKLDKKKILFVLGGIVVVTAIKNLSIVKQLSDKFGLVIGGKPPGPYLKYGAKRPSHIHKGIDIRAKENSPIYSAKNGVISLILKDGKARGYGNLVVVRHDNNEQTLYAHLAKFGPIKIKQKIKQGQLIGYVGKTHAPNTGKMSPHLHFEVHLAHTNKINRSTPERVDPETWLKDNNISIGV